MNQVNSIFELARNLCSNQDVDSLLNQITVSVERLLGTEAASILLLDSSKKQLTFKAATGEKGSAIKRFYVPMGQGIAGWVAQNGKPVIINDVESDSRFTGKIDKSSGFSTKSILAIPLFAQGELIGVCEALNKIEGQFSDSDQNVLESLGALAAVVINNARVSEDYRNFFSHTLEIIATAIEGADSRMTGHSFRVAQTACQIGREMGIQGEDYKNLYYAGILHDIGFLAVHDLRYLPKVVSKTMERTPEHLHPLVGAELVKDIRLLAPIAPIIRHHHEFVDGSGHPDGLVGDDIPLLSRILCLAEYMDDIFMKGAVREDFYAQAAQLAQEGSGKKFDPKVVNAFLASVNQAAA